MVSPPEFHYRGATLTLPVVTVSGDRSLGSRASISKDGTTQVIPTRRLGTSIRWIRGRRHHRPERLLPDCGPLEERTDGDAFQRPRKRQRDHDACRADGAARVTSAVAATSAGGQITLSGSGTDPARTDSYNSSVGDYSTSRGSFGTITTAGDVTRRELLGEAWRL